MIMPQRYGRDQIGEGSEDGGEGSEDGREESEDGREGSEDGREGSEDGREESEDGREESAGRRLGLPPRHERGVRQNSMRAPKRNWIGVWYCGGLPPRLLVTGRPKLGFGAPNVLSTNAS
jgi:hypothetical protein